MLNDGYLTALGTMSGTSLDGVDAAIVLTNGVDIAEFGPTAYRPYTTSEAQILHAHLGLWHDDDIAVAADLVEDRHIALMRPFAGIDIGGFHGQTLAHDPSGRGTHQCGDGQRLADNLGYPIAWDFRSADVRAGGQGAPLAPFFHFALARWLKCDTPVAFLNLGGVGNLTWIDPSVDRAEDPGALLAFDTGPANAPINDVMQARMGLRYDEGGALAASGQADAGILTRFGAHPYFTQTLPKSLDRDDFADLGQAVADLNDADAIATLTATAVQSVVQAMRHCPSPPTDLFVTGGGRRNATVMAGLAAKLDCKVQDVDAVGLNGDMLEAQAFAYLAVRVARNLPLSAPMTTGVPNPTKGGVLSHPAIK